MANYIASVLVPMESIIEMHRLLLIVEIVSKKMCVLKDMKYTVIDTIKGFKNSFTIKIKNLQLCSCVAFTPFCVV